MQNTISNGKVMMARKSLFQRIQIAISNYFHLVFIRWANIRNEWYFHFLMTPLIPIGLIVFLKFAGAVRTPAEALYVTAGNTIMSLIIGPMQSMSNDLALNKERRDFDFLALLPISRLQLILAYTTVSTIFTIPGMLITLFIGKLWFGFPMEFNIFVPVIMLLSALSMVGLGVMIGVNSKSIHHANIVNAIITALVTFMSPVLVQENHLPEFLRYLSKLFPTTYSAKAFRLALNGDIGGDMYFNLLILLGFTVAFLFIAVKKIDWRSN
ncbi:MAG TPA: ABC transporter permease [Thermotogota bacterium]|nr:ABC transporter permease [Thermotogota bacterium]